MLYVCGIGVGFGLVVGVVCRLLLLLVDMVLSLLVLMVDFLVLVVVRVWR